MNSKTKNIVIIAVMSVITLILLCALVAGIVKTSENNGALFTYSFTAEQGSSEQNMFTNNGANDAQTTEAPLDYTDATNGRGDFTLRKAQVQAIEIVWMSGNVSIENGSNSAVQVSETNVDTELTWELDGNGNLSIRCYEDDGNYRRSYNKDLTVLLPQNMKLDKFEIQSANSDVEIQTLQTNEFEIETATGNLNTQELNADSVSIKTASGSMQLAGSFAEEIDISSVSGDIEIESDCLPQEIDAKSVTGSFRVALPKRSKFFAEIKTAAGSVNADDFGLPVSQPSRGEYNIGDESYETEFHFETVSGNVRLTPA